MKNIIKKIQYYLGSSYRRKFLDKLLNENKKYFQGSVLDIGGGRKRGKFVPPKTKKWIFADITPELKPDVICNVEKMQFENKSFNTIKATELFEHVENLEQGIKECFRVLKKGGYFIISAPFLYPIHGDPFDFQRWTDQKWKKVLFESGFKIENLETMGGFFTLMSDMIKNVNKKNFFLLRYLGYFFYPLLDILVSLDSIKKIQHSVFGKYVEGYFIIAKKIE